VDTVTVRRQVRAPVERVWELATDLEHSPDILSGVERVEVLTPPPFGVGTRWRETRTMMGRQATEEMWVSAVEPQRSYTVEAESSGVHYVSTFRFEPSGDGAQLTLEFSGQPKGPATRLLAAVTAPLARRSVSKALGKDLEDLAAAAENA
jgi:carbon monoxide dehydrogenase subunit G